MVVLVYDSDSEHNEQNVVGNTAGFGELKNRSRSALDSRSAFLHNKPSYLLYFWELADEQGLLSSTLQRLDDSVGHADGGSSVSLLSSTTTYSAQQPKRKRGKSTEEEDDVRVSF